MSVFCPDQYYVLITGNGSTDLAVEALKGGACDFISKPFFVSDLIRSIDYANRKKELAGQRRQMLQRLEQELDRKEEELRNVYFPVLSSLAQAMETRDRALMDTACALCITPVTSHRSSNSPTRTEII
jgi:FixJ family two-component response regulator